MHVTETNRDKRCKRCTVCGASHTHTHIGITTARGAGNRVRVGRGARQVGRADEDAASQLVKLGKPSGLLVGPAAVDARRTLLLLLRLRGDRGIVGVGSDDGYVGIDNGGGSLGFLEQKGLATGLEMGTVIRRVCFMQGASKGHGFPAGYAASKHTYGRAKVAQVGEDLGKLEALHD